MRAVLTDVVKNADFIIAAPDRKKALPRDVKGCIGPRFGQVRQMAAKLPCSGQKPRLFDLEHLWIRVIARRQ